MSVKYELDYKAVEELEAKIKKIPGNIENIINGYLHREGTEITAEHITKYIRVSDPWVPKRRHAKTSKWWKAENENLGFTIKTKGGAANKPNSFGYLVFPNEGRGPRNPLEQRFMERGLDEATIRILDDLNELMDIKIKEELQ